MIMFWEFFSLTVIHSMQKAEQPLQGIELEEQEAQQDYSI